MLSEDEYYNSCVWQLAICSVQATSVLVSLFPLLVPISSYDWLPRSEKVRPEGERIDQDVKSEWIDTEPTNDVGLIANDFNVCRCGHHIHGRAPKSGRPTDSLSGYRKQGISSTACWVCAMKGEWRSRRWYIVLSSYGCLAKVKSIWKLICRKVAVQNIETVTQSQCSEFTLVGTLDLSTH